MTKARENSFKETPIQQIADKFFDLLLESFTPLRELSEETISAQELRTASLLGSSTIIRVLAGARNLTYQSKSPSHSLRSAVQVSAITRRWRASSNAARPVICPVISRRRCSA